MTPIDLANILCRHGIIQREAIEEPEGYDDIARIKFVESQIAQITSVQDFATQLELQSWRNHLTELLASASSRTS